MTAAAPIRQDVVRTVTGWCLDEMPIPAPIEPRTLTEPEIDAVCAALRRSVKVKRVLG